MSKRLLISDGAAAKAVTEYRVANSALVKDIQRALVVDGGVARQYWPTAGSTDPNVVWSAQPLTANDYKLLVNQPAIANINFAIDGSYTYTDDIDENNPATGNGTWLAVAVSGAGQYLIKAVVVAGAGTVGDTLNVWLDAFTPRSFGAQLAVQGVNSVVMDITVAGGVTSPIAGTEVTRRITFNAYVVNAASKVSWTQTQWDLDEHTEHVDADCDLNFFPNGTSTGLADTSGNFFENWHVDATIVPDPVNYTVQVDLISGTAPTGSALGAPLTLDVNRSWKLLATINEDLSNELDVTVGDGTAFVTKRVTMHSLRGAAPSSNVWTTLLWSLRDNAVSPNDALIQVAVNPDGTAFGDSPTRPPLNEDWHSEAPAASDPENYEVMLVVVSGELPDPAGSATGVWLSASPAQLLWELKVSNLSAITSKFAVWNLSIRRVGQPGITKQINLSASIGPLP